MQPELVRTVHPLSWQALHALQIVHNHTGRNLKDLEKAYYYKDANGNDVVIRQHNEHIYPDDPVQNRGTHYNDKYGNHYDYK